MKASEANAKSTQARRKDRGGGLERVLDRISRMADTGVYEIEYRFRFYDEDHLVKELKDLGYRVESIPGRWSKKISWYSAKE